jgi:truncated hemoglobin YjbI
MDSIYDRYGGQAFWERVMNAFYDKNLADPSLNAFFAGKDVERVKIMNRGLLSAALRPSGEHFPVSVKRVHRTMEISAAAFDRFGANLVATLTECGVSSVDSEEIMSVIASFRDDVVTKH